MVTFPTPDGPHTMTGCRGDPGMSNVPSDGNWLLFALICNVAVPRRSRRLLLNCRCPDEHCSESLHPNSANRALSNASETLEVFSMTGRNAVAEQLYGHTQFRRVVKMETANSVLCIIAARTRIRDSQWPPPAQPVRLPGQKTQIIYL
jgi:hypothetical protein